MFNVRWTKALVKNYLRALNAGALNGNVSVFDILNVNLSTESKTGGEFCRVSSCKIP